jgi:hypothetical protein
MEHYLIRKMFCERSGRYDLMNTDYTDNGADFFINAGQRHLDRLQNTGKMQAKNIQSVVAGTIQVKVAGLRSVLKVWAGNSTDGLIELKPASLAYLRGLYEKQLGDVDHGTPEWYAPAIFRPAIDTLSLTGLYDADDLIPSTTGHYTYSGIIIMPPPDETYYISIYGLYYSPEISSSLGSPITSGLLTVDTIYTIVDWLTDDDFTNVGGANVDSTIFTATGTTPTHWAHSSILKPWTQTKSFWTEVHPDILLQAALYKLETFYRNSEGAKDWKSSLTIDISDMDKDAAEEEAANISEMGG